MRRNFVFTIGHSTRPIDDFVHLLKSHEVQRVVDVRTLPRSRANPQFDITRLPELLRAAHIHYTHLRGLGGLRRPRRDSPNVGWRNKSFRAMPITCSRPISSAVSNDAWSSPAWSA